MAIGSKAGAATLSDVGLAAEGVKEGAVGCQGNFKSECRKILATPPIVAALTVRLLRCALLTFLCLPGVASGPPGEAIASTGYHVEPSRFYLSVVLESDDGGQY